MPELVVLQAARLKGRVNSEGVSAFAGVSSTEADAWLQEAVSGGHLDPIGASFRITASGREYLCELLESERIEIDEAGLKVLYEDFDGYNSAFKQIVTDWQLVDGITPNAHTNAGYDAGVLARLTTLHEGFAPLVLRAAAIAPRLAPYEARFADAISRIQSGDHSFVARPMMDSYHTVWFEFHEELIVLLDLSRVEEAAAGRAE